MAIPLKEIKKTVKENPKRGTGKKAEGSPFKKVLSYEIGGSKFGDSFKESFYSELALLIEAGLNVKSGLDLLASQQKKKETKELIESIVQQLTEGGRFSEVLRDSGKFSAYEYFSVKIGEETGNLVPILQRLSQYYSQKIKQRRSIIGALTYPLIVLLTAILAVGFMFTYMVPMFKDVFLRMGGELPWLTRVIMNISESFTSISSIFFLLIAIFLAIHFLNRNKESYQRVQYGLLLKVPVVGALLLKTHTLSTVQSLGLLITSRVPMTEALELSQRMIKFYPISKSLEGIRTRIFQGGTLSDGFKQYSIYEPKLVALIQVGEETNQLGMIMEKYGVQLEDELSHRAKVLGNTMEPIIIVFLGALVAVILVAMYMPMFQLSTQFG